MSCVSDRFVVVIHQANLRRYTTMCERDIFGFHCVLNEFIYAHHEQPLIRLLGEHDHHLVTGTACAQSSPYVFKEPV